MSGQPFHRALPTDWRRILQSVLCFSEAHSDIIRSICALPLPPDGAGDSLFASVANDCSLKVWSENADDCLACQSEAHDGFIFRENPLLPLHFLLAGGRRPRRVCRRDERGFSQMSAPTQIRLLACWSLLETTAWRNFGKSKDQTRRTLSK